MDSRNSSKPQESSCPSRKELSDFNTGNLSLPSIEKIAEHLERCSSCEKILLALLDNDDRVIAQLREADQDASFLEKSEFLRLQSKAKQIPLSSSDSTKRSKDDPPPPTQIARYSIKKQIGEGGFGKVYLANDDELNRFVAIKIPHSYRLNSQEDLERFQKEARILAGLDHPNIVPVYDVGQSEEGLFYVVSKYIHGNDLATTIKHSSFTFQESAQLVATAAHAMDYAHHQGLVHRDIKPRNILIDEDGEPHITDFGLAKQEASEHTISIDGQIVGTPAYMSPEQARGDGHHADRRSDIYSLGVVFYELLSGARPFRGNTQIVINQVLNVKPLSPRKIKKELPRDLETICLKAMAKDPNQRYETAKEMALDLERFLHGKAIKTKPIPNENSLWNLTRRHPATSLIVLLTLLAVIIFGLPPLLSNSTTTPNVENSRAFETSGFTPEDFALATPRWVSITTDPPGANVVFHPLSRQTGEPLPQESVRPTGTTPLKIKLPPGDYLVVAYLDDVQFHEVYRRVPTPDMPSQQQYPHRHWKVDFDGIVELHAIEIPIVSEKDPSLALTKEAKLLEMPMAFIEGASTVPEQQEQARIGLAQVQTFPPMLIDCRETSIGEYKKVFSAPLPPLMRQNPKPDNFAMTRVSWDDAVYYAELVGKRLPSEYEYEFVATQGGATDFPWENAPDQIANWNFGPAGESDFDVLVLDNNPPIYNLYSNVTEWMMNNVPQQANNAQLLPADLGDDRLRVIRGGPETITTGKLILKEYELTDPKIRHGRPITSREPGLGFRCVRSADPRLNPEDFMKFIKPE